MYHAIQHHFISVSYEAAHHQYIIGFSKISPAYHTIHQHITCVSYDSTLLACVKYDSATLHLPTLPTLHLCRIQTDTSAMYDINWHLACMPYELIDTPLVYNHHRLMKPHVAILYIESYQATHSYVHLCLALNHALAVWWRKHRELIVKPGKVKASAKRLKPNCNIQRGIVRGTLST